MEERKSTAAPDLSDLNEEKRILEIKRLASILVRPSQVDSFLLAYLAVISAPLGVPLHLIISVDHRRLAKQFVRELVAVFGQVTFDRGGLLEQIKALMEEGNLNATDTSSLRLLVLDDLTEAFIEGAGPALNNPLTIILRERASKSAREVLRNLKWRGERVVGQYDARMRQSVTLSAGGGNISTIELVMTNEVKDLTEEDLQPVICTNLPFDPQELDLDIANFLSMPLREEV